MKKSLVVTTGTLALAGALAGLGAFGGMAFAATPTPASNPTAVVSPSAPATTAVQAAAKSDTGKVNYQYQQQGNYQVNTGAPDKSETSSVEKKSAEKKSAEESPSGPDTDTLQVQVQQ
ncbi:hypothetical protein CEB3_c16340 [Peptococcaceae bacterium CEB3]|nr:hypothetical protein CEB3_c16340 [Peptococcaceae bacterium CEB3]